MPTNELGQDLDAFKAPELTELDYAEHHVQTIARALEKSSLAEVVEANAHSAGQVHLLLRVQKDNERKLVQEVGLSILRSVRGQCDSFFGKEYFLKVPPLQPTVAPAQYPPEEAAKRLSMVLASTGLAEVVETKWGPNQVHLLFRVNKENEKKLVHGAGTSILFACRPLGGSFFGKEYFIKDNALRYGWVFSVESVDLKRAVDDIEIAATLKPPMEGLLRYGWVMTFASKDLKETARLVCEAIDSVVPRYEVMESPLLGPGTPQGQGPGGRKGAAPIRGL